ncbi:late competence development ComFB family protein [Oceanospirillum sediminis]|uniref:Late competence development ComFB family protein n=1 Tax=Oceanospirillum sediminis TaxID=2760088 RepID=A0A839IK43_9GAMM|nr:late competence development ComFB family protein [Oceanospirillum sediminis]MBB1485271.1 late competence development ComFB family protein [Oceanospirillum sediminis]
MLFQNVQNYYEKLVLEALTSRGFMSGYEQGYVEDIACIALNNLPTQYIRFEVDMGFFLSSEDHLLMQKQVNEAVDEAVTFINQKLKESDKKA